MNIGEDENDSWIVTISTTSGVVTIVLPSEQAEKFLCRADEAGQSLPLYLKHRLGLEDGPMPQLVEFHRERGTYSAMFDKMAELGYRLVTVSFGRTDGNSDRVELVVNIDESGAIVTLAEKDVPILEYLYDTDRQAFGLREARTRRKKKPRRYQFPDQDGGHA